MQSRLRHSDRTSLLWGWGASLQSNGHLRVFFRLVCFPPAEHYCLEGRFSEPAAQLSILEHCVKLSHAPGIELRTMWLELRMPSVACMGSGWQGQGKERTRQRTLGQAGVLGLLF